MYWKTKGNATILSNEVAETLKDLIYEISVEKDFIINDLKVLDMNVVDIYVSAHPKYSISYIVKILKGISGRKLCLEFPNIKTNSQLWDNSFFVETI